MRGVPESSQPLWAFGSGMGQIMQKINAEFENDINSDENMGRFFKALFAKRKSLTAEHRAEPALQERFLASIGFQIPLCYRNLLHDFLIYGIIHHHA